MLNILFLNFKNFRDIMNKYSCKQFFICLFFEFEINLLIILQKYIYFIELNNFTNIIGNDFFKFYLFIF